MKNNNLSRRDFVKLFGSASLTALFASNLVGCSNQSQDISDIVYGDFISSNDLTDYEMFFHYADEEKTTIEPMFIVQRKQGSIPYIAYLDADENNQIIEKCICIGEKGSTSDQLQSAFIQKFLGAIPEGYDDCIISYKMEDQDSYSASDINDQLDYVREYLHADNAKLKYVDNADMTLYELWDMHYFTYYTDENSQEVETSIISVMLEGSSYNIYALDENEGKYKYSLLYRSMVTDKNKAVGEFLQGYNGINIYYVEDWLSIFYEDKVCDGTYTLDDVISLMDKINSDPQETLKKVYSFHPYKLRPKYCVTLPQLVNCTVVTQKEAFESKAKTEVVLDGFAPISAESLADLEGDYVVPTLSVNENETLTFGSTLNPSSGLTTLISEEPFLPIVQECIGEDYYYTTEEIAGVIEQLESGHVYSSAKVVVKKL